MIVASTDGLTELREVHGGRGVVLWKVFALGGALFSDLESFEYCRVRPGASLGEHVHSRNEEVYYVISGRGKMRIGADAVEVGPGDLVLTPLGGLHGIDNPGEEDLEFVCAEATPPAIAALLPKQSPVVEEPFDV